MGGEERKGEEGREGWRSSEGEEGEGRRREMGRKGGKEEMVGKNR